MTFRLAPGVSDDAFLAADRSAYFAGASAAVPFLRRTTARGEDGSWLVVTLWDGEAADLGQALDGLVEGLEVRRWHTLD